MFPAAPKLARWPQALRALAATLAHAPENAAYGLVAFAPLGLAFGPVAMALALLSAVAANAVSSTWGGGHLVGGPRASLALLTSSLVASLIPLWSSGPPADAAWIVLIVTLGVVGAGLLQVLFGMLKLGELVKYTPFPVRVGLASGIGLLLALTAWPVMSGQGFGVRGQVTFEGAHIGALAVGAIAAAVTGAALWRRSRVPPLLLGLLAGVAAHAVMGALADDAAGGRVVGVLQWSAGILDMLRQATWPVGGDADLPWSQTLRLLLGYALTVAVLSSLDTLLVGSLVDGRLRQWRDPNKELVAQGLANVAAALAGAQPASPSVPRSLSLVSDQRPWRHAVLGYALLLLLVTAVAPWALAWLPQSALGGVLLAQGLAMVSPSLLITPWALLRAQGSDDTPRSGTPLPHAQLLAHWMVSLAVVLAALTWGVGPAVLIGAGLAVLLFVRNNLRDVVRGAWRADQRHSMKVRPLPVMQTLHREGRRIALLELEGALFFGTADALRARLQRLATEVDSVVLDLRQIREVDVTGARILFECAEDWTGMTKLLILAEWPAGDARRQMLLAVAGPTGAPALQFEDHADGALERAEDALLARLGLQPTDGGRLTLDETALASGLDATELACLRAAAQPVHFAPGSLLFQRGDPGDAVFLCLAGHVALRVPGGNRRLASLAPGVSLGEISLLTRGQRTVDAIAENDVDALRLPVETFDRWRQERPELAAKLLHNMALQLAGRLHLLTDELAGWVERAGAAPAPQTRPVASEPGPAGRVLRTGPAMPWSEDG